MNTNFISKIVFQLQESAQKYGLNLKTQIILMLAPVVVILIQGIAFLNPYGRKASLWLLQENYPIEFLSFVIFLASGFYGLRLAVQARNQGEAKQTVGFYTLFSLILIFIGLEEAAWGQWLFGFEVPQTWQEINMQGDLTLHNLPGLQGNTELMRIGFGLGGLAGIWLIKFPYFKKIGSPALLWPWFVVIASHATLDYVNDFFVFHSYYDFLVGRSAELIELLIAICAFLYLYLNKRRFFALNPLENKEENNVKKSLR